MRRCRAQILADRQNLAADLAQILERGDELVVLLAETDHQAGLGRDVRRVAARALEQLQRARIAAARARHAVQPRHRFGVVIQHVRPRVEHGLQRPLVALEIGNQHFDPAVGQARACLADGLGEDRRAAVRRGRRDRPR